MHEGAGKLICFRGGWLGGRGGMDLLTNNPATLLRASTWTKYCEPIARARGVFRRRVDGFQLLRRVRSRRCGGDQGALWIRFAACDGDNSACHGSERGANGPDDH